MDTRESKKKQIIIYIIIAYGVTFLMGAFMWYGWTSAGTDLSVFPNAQMFYPAAGVMLAYLLTRKSDTRMPRRFYITFIAMTGVLVICAIASVFFPGSTIMSVSPWAVYLQLILLAGSILCWIMLLTERKEKRIAYGLKFVNGKMSVLMVLLFVGLYLLRSGISYAASGQLAYYGGIFANPMTWYMLANILLSFFISFTAFFGEEYGWRYFLQPLMQKRFGKRWGVILLGVVWGLWHMPVNFFYYSSPGSGLVSMAAQQITCITLGIFFAYAYMKTNNIWVPVVLHFLNNNLILIVSGTYNPSVIQNQTMTWISLVPALIVNGIMFGLFLFSRIFRREKKNTRENLSEM